MFQVWLLHAGHPSLNAAALVETPQASEVATGLEPPFWEMVKVILTLCLFRTMPENYLEMNFL